MAIVAHLPTVPLVEKLQMWDKKIATEREFRPKDNHSLIITMHNVGGQMLHMYLVPTHCSATV